VKIVFFVLAFILLFGIVADFLHVREFQLLDWAMDIGTFIGLVGMYSDLSHATKLSIPYSPSNLQHTFIILSTQTSHEY
jgi:hypothetical protein